MSTPAMAVAEPTTIGTDWTIDNDHSNVEFSVKHMMIATVTGTFENVSGTIHWDGEHLESAAVEASIATQSISTHNQLRDNHLRSGDFLLAERFPDITFASTSIELTGADRFKIHGDLTIRDRTLPIVLDTKYRGQIAEGAGKHRAAFSGTTRLSRKAFGVSWNERLDGGGVVVSDTVKVTLNISAVQQS